MNQSTEMPLKSGHGTAPNAAVFFLRWARYEAFLKSCQVGHGFGNTEL